MVPMFTVYLSLLLPKICKRMSLCPDKETKTETPEFVINKNTETLKRNISFQTLLGGEFK